MIEDFSEILVEAFYSGETPNWEDLAFRSGLSAVECERQWRALQGLSLKMARLKVLEVSPLVLNRLSVLAREAVAPKPTLWQKLLSPRLVSGFAVALLAMVVGTRLNLFQPTPNPLAKIPVEQSHFLASPIISERLFTTTFDQIANYDGTLKNTNSQPRRKVGQFSLASPVSLGNTDVAQDVDLLKTNLNAKEVETLYFRARKFEQQGYYRDALKDYQFLAEFYPNSLAPQTLHLAMARCLEGLGQDEAALKLLKKSAISYGASQDLQMMVEELKSQTF